MIGNPPYRNKVTGSLQPQYPGISQVLLLIRSFGPAFFLIFGNSESGKVGSSQFNGFVGRGRGFLTQSR